MRHLEATEKDLLQWCSEFRKDKVKNRLARLVYQSDMEVLRRQSKAEIERDVEEAFKLGWWPATPEGD